MAKRKRYGEPEWSFSFEQLGEKLEQMGERLGERFNMKMGAPLTEANVKTASYAEPRGETKSARIRLSGGVGRLTVQALENDDNLFEAEIRYIDEVQYEVTGEAEKTIVLEHQHHTINFKGWGWKPDELNLYTEIRVNPNVPIWLELDGGLGPAELELSSLQIRGLDIDGGVGTADIYLPVMDETYRVDIDGGVGKNQLYIAEGAAMIIEIDGGVGKTGIQVPESAALKVDVSGSIGGVDIASHLKRIRKSDSFISRSGTWETEGFAEAERKIFIRYEGGVGKLDVTTPTKATRSKRKVKIV